MCFACLPISFDLISTNGEEERSIVIVAPLTALIEDQVRSHHINKFEHKGRF